MAQPQLSAAAAAAAAAAAEQQNCGDGKQEAAALIPGLPRDLAVHCLALVPGGHYLARERHAKKEEWLYVVGYGRPSQWLAYDFGEYKPCVWVYDVTTNHWVSGAPMQVGRAEFFNVVLKNDVLVGGGWITHDLRPARHVETLDCAKEESAWQSLPLILDTVTHIVREAFCLNGRLWTLHSAANVGGQSFGAQIYNPEVKEWQQGPAFLVEDGVTASANDILYIVDRHCVLHTYTQISERGFVHESCRGGCQEGLGYFAGAKLVLIRGDDSADECPAYLQKWNENNQHWQALTFVIGTQTTTHKNVIVHDHFEDGRLWTLHQAANVEGQSFGAQIYIPEVEEWQQGPAFVVESGGSASAPDTLYIVHCTSRCDHHTYTQISERGFVKESSRGEDFEGLGQCGGARLIHTQGDVHFVDCLYPIFPGVQNPYQESGCLDV
eukprot:SM000008S22153  [mRNA]  locus=s8:44060:54131:- [translate_table: standard]